MNSNLIQPFSELGLELWVDDNDRLMISIPNVRQKRQEEKFLLPVRNQDGKLVGNLVFKKQITVKTQTLFSAEEWLDPHSQNQDQLISLLPVLGLSRSNSLMR